MDQIPVPTYLQNRQRRRSLVEEHISELGMPSPPYVSIMGGTFTLIDSTGKQEPIKTRHLDAVIIDMNRPSRVYWGARSFDPNADSYQAPECFSDNGVGASKNAVHPQSTNCQTCKQSEWGSATSKVTGKPTRACGTLIKTAVLAYTIGEPDKEGVYTGNLAAIFPFLLRIPVMSHDNFRNYLTKFQGQDFDVSEVVTRIYFVERAVGQLNFSAVGFLTPDRNTAVDDILAKKITDTLVGRNDQPITALPPGQLDTPKFPELQQRVPEQVHASAVPTPEPIFGQPTLHQEAAKKSRGRPRKNDGEGNVPVNPTPKPKPLAPQQAPFATNQASHGIVTDAEAPPEEVQRNLASLFNLDTSR